MQQVFAIIAAAGALTTPQTGIAQSAPVAVNACAVSDLYNYSSSSAEFGSVNAYHMLQISFLNTDEATATQVTFDVTHGGARATVNDRGRFTKGIAIEHLYDELPGANAGGPVPYTVTAITFADGRRWTAPGGPTKTASTQQ